jgi:hypothetical protein
MIFSRLQAGFHKADTSPSVRAINDRVRRPPSRLAKRNERDRLDLARRATSVRERAQGGWATVACGSCEARRGASTGAEARAWHE